MCATTRIQTIDLSSLAGRVQIIHATSDATFESTGFSAAMNKHTNYRKMHHTAMKKTSTTTARKIRTTTYRCRHLSAFVSLIGASLVVAGCGNSSSSSSGPDPIVDDTTTSELVNNASVNIGGSLDTALNGVSRVTSGSMGSDGFTEDPAESGIGGLWSNDAQSLVDTSLNLGNEENTIREGSRITIDPDDASVCAEELIGMDGNDEEFQRCVALVSDMLVQIDASSDTAGSLTYLFQNQALVAIDYTDTSNSFELNLGTLKSLIDTNNALNPDAGNDSPLDTIQGAIRLSATATNQNSGSEAGSVSLEVSQPLSVVSADAGTTLSLGTGKILSMSADAADESASIEIELGALRASESDEGSVRSIDMDGLTAIIDIDTSSDLLTVRNLGIGQGPLRVALDNADVLNLGLDTFGFTASMDSEDITLTGGLNLSLVIRQIFEDNTVSDTLFTMLEMTAPAGTRVVEQLNGSLMVASGGPLNYSLTTQDEDGNPAVNQVTVEVGQCADNPSGEQQLVSCE